MVALWRWNKRTGTHRRVAWAVNQGAAGYPVRRDFTRGSERRLPETDNKRGGEWSFKNSGSRKILVEFHGSHSLVFLAVMCVSQSRFFIGRCLGVPTFVQDQWSRSPDSFACCKMTSSRHSILTFIKATFNFREKVNPKLSDFHKS